MTRAALRAIELAFIAVDCLVNVLLLGSWNETLSARAHRMRVKPQPYWWWLADAIDTLLFWQPDHCHAQYLREIRYGGVWAAWRAAA